MPLLRAFSIERGARYSSASLPHPFGAAYTSLRRSSQHPVARQPLGLSPKTLFHYLIQAPAKGALLVSPSASLLGYARTGNLAQIWIFPADLLRALRIANCADNVKENHKNTRV